MLEYVGVWLITLVVTFFGMNAAMMVGAVADLIVAYVVEMVVRLHRVRGVMSAVTLRSNVSSWKRNTVEILDGKDRVGGDVGGAVAGVFVLLGMWCS